MTNKEFIIAVGILSLAEGDELFRDLMAEIFDMEKLVEFVGTEWQNVGEGEARLYMLEVLKENFSDFVK